MEKDPYNFAYVKVISGDGLGKKRIIKTSLFSPVLNPSTHKSTKKYNVLCEKIGQKPYKIQVLFFGGSREEIEKKINSPKSTAKDDDTSITRSSSKRICNVPSKFLTSASDSEKKEERILKRACHSELNSDELEAKRLKGLAERKISLLENNKQTSSTIDKSIDSSTVNDSSSKYIGRIDNENRCRPTEPVSKDITRHMQTPSRATEIRTVPNDNMDNASESTSKCLENKENNSYCESKYSTAKVAVMQKEIKSLKKKVAELEEENNELSSNLKHYRLKLHEKDKYIKTLSDLNMDLQQTVIEKSKEYNDRVEEFLNAKNSISTGDNYPKIEILRTTDGINRIHLGKNIFVPEKSYSAFLTNSKTPSQCAGNLLILVFDIEELMTGTRTGFTSNASAVGKKTCSKLDEIKYSVCADFYCYWMETIYKPDKKQVEQFDIDLLKFNTYAAKKIADLKRDPEKKKNKKSSKRSAGSVSETDSVQGSSLDNITNKNNGDNDKGPSSDVLSKDKDRNIENQNISEEIANQKYTVVRADIHNSDNRHLSDETTTNETTGLFINIDNFSQDIDNNTNKTNDPLEDDSSDNDDNYYDYSPTRSDKIDEDTTEEDCDD